MVRSYGYYTWSSDSLSAKVRTWIQDPTRNSGFLFLHSNHSTRDAKLFSGRFSSNFDERPTLIVNYTINNKG